MTLPKWCYAAATAGVVLVILASPASAQKQWTPPHTIDGQPDLQGVWTNATITPFERPAQLAGKAYLTEQEAAELEKQSAKSKVDRPPSAGDVGNYNQVWFDSGTKVVGTRQTSLVMEPANGLVPVKPAAEAKRDYDLAHISDSYEHMSIWDRCITRGVPGRMFPAGYNNAYQIVQSAGNIVIMSEMIHDARVIPLDGRAHAPKEVRAWDGDSRGHWEGNTLVVVTKNLNGMTAAGGNGGGRTSDRITITERFTMMDVNTLQYTATIDDPGTWTQPWTLTFPWKREPNYGMFEYACHEGNYAMRNILTISRAMDKASGK